MQTNQWIWQHSDWPAFYYDAGSLLTEISKVSALVGGLETVCWALGDDERTGAWERVLTMLIDGIGEDDMKLTAKGNLGQKFCQEASRRYFDHYPDRLMSRISVRTETNFAPCMQFGSPRSSVG